MSEKRKLLGPLEWTMFVLAICILGYIVLQKGGIHVIEQSATTEIVDNPGSSDFRQKKRPYRERKTDESVEAVLKELAVQFSAKEEAHIKTTQKMEEKGMSRDEVKYYKGVKKKYEAFDKIKDAKDWFKVLKSANDTYRKLQSTFGKAAGQSPEAVASTDVESVLNNARSAKDVYANLKNYFGISEEDAKAFAERGKRTLSDWAQFVEEQQK